MTLMKYFDKLLPSLPSNHLPKDKLLSERAEAGLDLSWTILLLSYSRSSLFVVPSVRLGLNGRPLAGSLGVDYFYSKIGDDLYS